MESWGLRSLTLLASLVIGATPVFAAADSSGSSHEPWIERPSSARAEGSDVNLAMIPQGAPSAGYYCQNCLESRWDGKLADDSLFRTVRRGQGQEGSRRGER